jgi:hypothetical protein
MSAKIFWIHLPMGSPGMIRLIREHELAAEFKRLKARQRRVSLAAPFWGLGAASMLGLRRGPEIRVLCRFDSPACNPKALLELIKVGALIRSHRRLHAKLYITDAAVIIGSSNPSRYGVTQEGDILGGTVEANILTDDSSVVGETRDLFQRLWDDQMETTQVSSRMVEQEIRRRELDPPAITPRTLTARSLLSACREAPELFGKVFVVAYNTGLGDGGKAALKQLQSQSGASDEELGIADFRNAWGYQFENAPLAGSWLVDLSCKGKSPRVWGASRVPLPALRLRVRGENDVTPTIRGIVSVPGAVGDFRMSAQDKADILSVAQCLLRDGEDFVALPRVVEMIDKAKRAVGGAPRDGVRAAST